MKYLLVLSVLIGIINTNAQLKIKWQTPDNLNAPESVIYDEARAFIYVSNFNNNPKNGESYGNDFISKISKNGEIIKIDWITNLTAPTGICISKDLLYIVERFGVVVYDLKQDKIKTKHLIQDANFLNDITVDPDTNIYVSDSGSKVIYRIKSGTVEKWIESDEIANTNGVLYDDGKVLAGVNIDNYLKSINIKTKEVTKIAYIGDGGIDGIFKCGENYMVSLYKGNIFIVTNNGEVTEILNTRSTEMFCADFTYIDKEGIIAVPALWKNIVIGYEYSPSK